FANFGAAVAIEGSTIVVGAPADDPNGPSSGSAYVFTQTGSSWDLQQKLTDPAGHDYESFGIKLSLSHDRVLLGTYESGGSAHIFARSGSAWSYEQRLQPADLVDFSY